MKFLVLGSAGQVGEPLCRYLKSINHEVITFDIVDDAREDLRLFNNAKLDAAVAVCDFVFFLAWDVGGSRYLIKHQNTVKFMQNNLRIIDTVFDALCRHSKPFVFVSSQMANMSHSGYGLTKALGEKFAESLGGISVKLWNVYGPERDLEKSHVVTDFVRQAKSGCIQMLTDGTESRQMLHVDDCARAFYILSQNYSKLPRDQSYHITSFEWVTIMQVAQAVASCFPGCKIQSGVNQDGTHLGVKNEPDAFIKQFWQPEINLQQGVRLVIDAMGKHT